MVQPRCHTVECELDWSHEECLRLRGCLAVQVSRRDDVPHHPRCSLAVEPGRPSYIYQLWGPSRTTRFGPSNHQCLERAYSFIPAEQETAQGRLVCCCRYPRLFELSALAHFCGIAALAVRRLLSRVGILEGEGDCVNLQAACLESCTAAQQTRSCKRPRPSDAISFRCRNHRTDAARHPTGSAQSTIGFHPPGRA